MTNDQSVDVANIVFALAIITDPKARARLERWLLAVQLRTASRK